MKIMSALYKNLGLILIFFLFIPAVFAQTTGFPHLKKSENYKSVRVKMLKAGWKPYHKKTADICMESDERCQGRPVAPEPV